MAKGEIVGGFPISVSTLERVQRSTLSKNEKGAKILM